MVFRNWHFAYDFIPKHQLFLLKVRSWRELWSTEEQSQEGNFDDSHQGDHHDHVWWSFSLSLIIIAIMMIIFTLSDHFHFHVWWSFSLSLNIIIVMSDYNHHYLWSHLSFDWDFVLLWSWRAIQLEETQTTSLVLISPDLPVIAFADWRWIEFCFGVFSCCYVSIVATLVLLYWLNIFMKAFLFILIC